MKKIFSILAAVLFSATMFASTYVVAGAQALMGSKWDKADAQNQMALVEGIYTLVKENVTLGAGTYQYKVVKDNDWDAMPMDNQNLVIAADGIYNVTFTFNESVGKESIKAEAEKKGDAEVIPVIGVKGAWDSWAKTTTLVLADNKETASVKLTIAEGVHEFGLESDGSWLANGKDFKRAEPAQVVEGSGSNMKLHADLAGEYTFTWTYETKTLTITFPEGVVIPAKFYITGDSALVTDAGAPGKAWKPDAIKSEKDTFVLNLKADQDYVLKVAVNGTWKGENNVKGYNELTEKTKGLKDISNDHNIGFKLNASGVVKVVYIAAKGDDPEVFKVIGDFVEPKLENGFYLVGVVGGVAPAGDWDNIDAIDAANLLVRNTEATENEEYQLKRSLSKDDEFQVIKVVYDNIETWYPGGIGTNLVVGQTGVYTISFRPNKDGADDWWHKYIHLALESATAVDNTEATVKSVKTLQNGMLIIEKNGVRYNVLGQSIR